MEVGVGVRGGEREDYEGEYDARGGARAGDELSRARGRFRGGDKLAER